MKSFKTAIIAVIVLVVVIAGYFVATNLIEQNNETNATPVPESSTVTIYEYNSDDVVKIVTEGMESFTLELGEDEIWKCTSHPHLNISDSAVYNIVTLLDGVTGELLYDEGAFKGELKDFGLDDPHLFTIYFKDGKSITYKTGDLNPSGTSYYVMLDGSDKIYAVNTTYGIRLRLSQATITESDLITFADTADLRSIQLTRKGSVYYRMEADLSGDSEDDKQWQIIEPIKITGNASNIESFIEALDALSFADTAEPNCTDLTKYGLENPSYEYTFTDSKDTYVLSVGNSTTDGSYYYCTVNGGNDVLRVYASSLTFLDNTMLSYAYTYAFFENYTTLNSIEIDIRGNVNEKHELVFQFGEDNAEMITLDGVGAKKVDKNGNTVYDYLYEVKGITTYCYALQVDAVDIEMSLPKGDLLCRITYNRQDGTSCVVEAYERDEATAYLYVDGEYMGGYCDTWRIFSTTDHQGIVGTIDAFEKLIADAT